MRMHIWLCLIFLIPTLYGCQAARTELRVPNTSVEDSFPLYSNSTPFTFTREEIQQYMQDKFDHSANIYRFSMTWDVSWTTDSGDMIEVEIDEETSDAGWEKLDNWGGSFGAYGNGWKKGNLYTLFRYDTNVPDQTIESLNRHYEGQMPPGATLIIIIVRDVGQPEN